LAIWQTQSAGLGQEASRLAKILSVVAALPRRQLAPCHDYLRSVQRLPL
jgi:hypothetical protein